MRSKRLRLLLKQHRKSTLRYYIFCYMTITLLSCSIIACIFFVISVNSLGTSLKNAEQEKLTMVANDFREQFDSIQKQVFVMSTSLSYQPSYLSRNAFYEIDLIDEVKRIKSTSPILSDYFILYENDRNVFMPKGKMPFDVYCDKFFDFNKNEASSLYESIILLNTENTLPLHSDEFLMVFPLHFYSSIGNTQSAWFCAYLPLKVLFQRANLISGGFESNFSIEYNQSFTGDDDTFHVQSFDISLQDMSNEKYSMVQHFQKIGFIFTICFATFLILLAVMLAFITYLPIKKVVQRHLPTQKNQVVQSNDEIAMLDKMLSNADKQHKLSVEQITQMTNQIHKQQKKLKEYLLLALANNEWSIQTLSSIENSGIILDGAYFSAIIIHFNKALSYDESEKIISSLECLSCDDMHCYSMKIDSLPSFFMIISAKQSASIDQLRGILADIINTEVEDIPRISFGSIVSSLSQLSVSLDSALSNSGEKKADTCFVPNIIESVLSPIRDEKSSLALNKLVEFNNTVTQCFPSVIAQRVLYANLVSAIFKIAHTKGIEITGATTSVLNGIPSSVDFQNELSELICGLCDDEASQSQIDSRTQQIMRYIEEHIFDYDLALDTVAENFGLSGRQISRIIARETGYSYKDYLLDIRVKKAKSLLLEGNSVKAVSEMLHYSSIPYFIKLFHSKTGVTPAKYKSVIEKEKSDIDISSNEEK